MHKIASPLVACLLALAATGASAQSFWKWRDAAGQLHISDTAPPVGTPANAILQRPNAGAVVDTPAATAASAAGSAPESDLQKKKKKADQEKAEAAAADKAALDQKNAAIRRENCQRAQAQVAGFQSGTRIATLNAKGEREFMDDATRAAELQRLQTIVQQNCGAAADAQ